MERSKMTEDEDDFVDYDDKDDSSFGGSSKEGAESGSSEPMPNPISSNEPENQYFGQSENRKVKKFKNLVFVVLFLVTLAVCLVVYFLTRQGQEDEFEASFLGSAATIIASFEGILEEKIAAIAAFGVTMTASAIATNSTWPFVTIDQFQQRSASSGALSGCLYLQITPIVTDDNRFAWEEYSVANAGWLTEGREYQDEKGLSVDYSLGNSVGALISRNIISMDESGAAMVDQGPGPYFPIWQSSPVLPVPLDGVNFNLRNMARFGDYVSVASSGQIVVGGLDTAPVGGMNDPDPLTRFFAIIISLQLEKPANYTGEPVSSVYIPIMDSFANDRKTVAILGATLRWESYFENILTESTQPVRVVLSNSCQDIFTYEIRGSQATFVGKGNRADLEFEGISVSVDLDENDDLIVEPNTIALTLNQDLCRYTLRIYPTQEGYVYHNNFFPLIITLTVAAVFLMTAAVFYFYDMMVERRQKVVLDTAQRSTAIVSSIFPKNVRDQLLQAPVQGNATKLRFLADARKLDNGQHTSSPMDVDVSSRPIADLFLNCTVMFADVEGFTAWSSVREPSQVFTLLETLYSAFDYVAQRRRVFKVETVGDCYVAVSGLPDPRQDHAVTMARFARDCVTEHIAAVKKLESTLGPETGDLRLRVGLHSGSITAGVLRGERSRFQLFGDTVNTAARIESSGEGNRIHVSSTTATLIMDAGHERWIESRERIVTLKGKGSMQTYWLIPRKKDLAQSGNIQSGSTTNAQVGSISEHRTVDFGINSSHDGKKQSLISFNADALLRVIKKIEARRETTVRTRTTAPADTRAPVWKKQCSAPLAEVVEVIELPIDSRDALFNHPNTVDPDPKVTELVYKYVSLIADMYPDNPFHNFEHASHVAMSVTKLLSRIVAPSDMNFTNHAQASAKLHDHTYGITSDPLTQFACVLSALIHDVDHPGVSNATLVAEGDQMMQMYGDKSLAEQNSVDKAWNLLMSKEYQPLVAILCRDENELSRLRQLVVNSVMATDIMDPDLKNLRNGRWEKAFKNTNIENEEVSRETINRKATIVIEHLIQASDVAHTMQHWNVYTKWNARLFKEMYKAYLDGRSGAKDPSEFWAKGEIGFFDFYVIPLAKKLKECGVFGVSSDEYLQYAISNRNEWEEKGHVITERIIKEVWEEHMSSSFQGLIVDD